MILSNRKGSDNYEKRKNYYTEIDSALKSYENFKPWHEKSFDWIRNRIDWCWKFKHITESQMKELVDRIIEVMDKN